MPANVQEVYKVATTATVNATLAFGTHTPVDASGGGRTMTLPTTGVVHGSELSIEKVDATGNSVIISGSIRGVANATLTLTLQNESVALRADASGSWWPVAGHKTKTSLDGLYVSKTATLNYGLTIVETATGVWSGDAPVRAAGKNPILFIGVHDPADATNGIATPGNINTSDSWDQIS